MSIATLKKKSQTLYKNMSVGQKQFSINGTTRNQGYVGQTSLSRSLIHTPHKGSDARGHGGCCVNPMNIKASETFSLEDNTVVKKSSLSTRGMLATKNRWINRPFPNAVVKTNAGAINDQTSWIERLKKKTLMDIEAYCPSVDANGNKFVSNKNCASSLLTTKTGFPLFSDKQLTCNTSKDMDTVSHSKYLLTLHEKCVLQDTYKFVSPVQRTPFVGNN
jgi:hypothetical protein